MQRCEEEAEQWWLKAAESGSDRSCSRAQNTLGMFYSRPDSTDLKKASCLLFSRLLLTVL